jgi:very-short-patch-repair endonuclease
VSFKPRTINRDRARAMRADPTRAENALWQALRNRQLEGYKFRRQVPLKHAILDFVCFEARLIVEVDGFQHAGSLSDQIRDRVFQMDGFTILRFWNEEVEKNLDSVCLKILGYLKSVPGQELSATDRSTGF